MTEAGQKWVGDIADTQEFADWHDMASPLSKRAAEFWVRAFCDEVESRAKAHYSDGQVWPTALWTEFDKFKRELLGD